MRYRAFVIPAVGAVTILVGLLVFGSLGDSLVYYQTPTEAVENQSDFDDGRRFRLSGFVSPGTVRETADGVAFIATDGTTEIAVVHTKSPPQLFQENIQVVVEGSWDGAEFHSDSMLVKHDEEYRVPESGNYPGAEAAP